MVLVSWTTLTTGADLETISSVELHVVQPAWGGGSTAQHSTAWPHAHLSRRICPLSRRAATCHCSCQSACMLPMNSMHDGTRAPELTWSSPGHDAVELYMLDQQRERARASRSKCMACVHMPCVTTVTSRCRIAAGLLASPGSRTPGIARLPSPPPPRICTMHTRSHRTR